MTAQKEALRRFAGYFTRSEKLLWALSVSFILVSFCIFDRESYMTLCASLIGVTSLIFNAKGNPFGQLLAVVFSLLYGGISYTFAYYGEMITYLGMTMPMAVFALIAWLRNPYNGNRAEVRVNAISRREAGWMCLGAAAVTAVFYFVLAYFRTANLLPSTVSVTTSFLAVYLTFRRSPYFALAYAANDLVLIVLWTLASAEDIRYISVVVCFAAFFANDIYGYISWQRMKLRQARA
ncbi:MAG TPA: nicotinamide riboside transporter PnuC [Candidatus Faecalibacterium intestinigallinarum]|uniref:Nicotinamide riboside transporter PnuC n=1 Tax=Candidatus Faecalibacterium intestinigallinarum TaxID=2838581 RepID=A0A9D1Q9B9_9FIRM|nr:nicotinamide riboside transporter PnuC [Candidatus Faecalibacterium intestinigallinarum]